MKQKRTSVEPTPHVLPQLRRHLQAIEHTFSSLETAERMRTRDPVRGMAVMREAIRGADKTFTPAALADMRRLILAVAFWHATATPSLLAEFDHACALLPEPEEGWLEGFLDFLIALHAVLLRAVEAVGVRDRPAAQQEEPERIQEREGANETAISAADERTKLYSIQEASEILKLPVTWLYERTRKNAIPHRRLGKYVRFSEADMQAIIAAVASRN